MEYSATRCVETLVVTSRLNKATSTTLGSLIEKKTLVLETIQKLQKHHDILNQDLKKT
jgi:hypothetical protein